MVISKIGFFLRKSIFNKILFSIIILILLPLLFTIGFTYSKVLTLSQAEFEKYSLESVKQIEHSLSAYFKQMDALTYTIVANDTVQEYLSFPEQGYELEKIQAIQKIRFFENNIRYDNAYNTIVVISGLNKELYSSYGYFSNLDHEYDFINNPYTEMINEGNTPVLYLGTHLNEAAFYEKMVLSLIRGIHSTADNRLLGYLYLNIDYSIFDNIINNVVFSDGNDLQILDGGKIIYSTNSDNVLKLADSGLYKAVSAAEEGSMFLKIDGIQYFLTYTTMDKTGWKVVSLHSMASYNNKAFKLIRFIIAISAIGLIISIIIAVLISLAITRPVKNLISLMKKIENEDFDVHFSIKSKDEIATLGNVFNSMVKRIRDLIKRVYKSGLMEKDAVIYALQSQINPHFLYNTLQSISNIAQLENVPDISTMCRCLSSMFRYSMETKRRFVMLYDEVEHVRNFFYLQSIQYNDRLKFSINIPDEYLSIRVPRFILQPLVENSVLHGIYPKPSGGEIRISALKDDENLRITVEDDGVGIEGEKLKEILENINEDISDGEGLGSKFLALNNVNKRLVLNYGKEYALKIESGEGAGTRVTIIIPIDSCKREDEYV